jgi:hypothetical protein
VLDLEAHATVIRRLDSADAPAAEDRAGRLRAGGLRAVVLDEHEEEPPRRHELLLRRESGAVGTEFGREVGRPAAEILGEQLDGGFRVHPHLTPRHHAPSLGSTGW